MGLAVLPARLKDELELLKTYILEKKTSEAMRPLQSTRTGPKVLAVLSGDQRRKCHAHSGTGSRKGLLSGLEDAGVYKCTDEGLAAFGRFVETL